MGILQPKFMAEGVVRLSHVLGALSHALDLTDGQPQGHSQRCAWVGHHMGRKLGLDHVAMNDLYYTVLLKDLGCSANSARIAAVYRANERAVKRDFKLLDGSPLPFLRFTFATAGAKGSLRDKLRTMAHVMRDGAGFVQEVIDTRCHRGAAIAAKLRFPKIVQDGIRSLDEHWDGSGQPQHLKGAAIPLYSRIALMAQLVDVMHFAHGVEATKDEMRRRAGTWFDPELVRIFLAAQAEPGFWEALKGDTIADSLLHVAPWQSVSISDEADEIFLDDIAEAFAAVIDAKSPFTGGHSQRVMLYADRIAEALGYDQAERRWLRRGALLHDIGKLGVGNDILDKNGKPTDEEWAVIRSHPVHSRAIITQVPAFSSLATMAGGHHETLNGRGYPDGLTADELDLHTRILTVADVYDALSADRPYRAALSPEEAFAILDKDTGVAFDASCVDALKLSLAAGEGIASPIGSALGVAMPSCAITEASSVGDLCASRPVADDEASGDLCAKLTGGPAPSGPSSEAANQHP